MSSSKKNDEERWSALMQSAQQGNENDYRQLLRELDNAIEAYLRSRFGDIDVLEDCVQESLIAVHKARNTYESHRLFRPWLFAIVKYKAIDVLRKKNSFRKMTEKAWPGLDNSELSYVSPEAELSYGDFLSGLSEKHREAIILTKIQGLSMREAAIALNISEGAMKVRVHRALSASRQLLKVEVS